MVAAKARLVETLDGYLHQLASTQPTPGGGSAAAIVGALGAALVAMVARICASNPTYAAHRESALAIGSHADGVRDALSQARQRDESAYAAVVAAQALPRESDGDRARRRTALESALSDAAQAPLDACGSCVEVLRLCVRLLEIPNRALAGDVGCATEFGYAAAAACAYNVRINHRYMKDGAAVERQDRRLQRLQSEAGALLERTRVAVAGTIAR